MDNDRQRQIADETMEGDRTNVQETFPQESICMRGYTHTEGFFLAIESLHGLVFGSVLLWLLFYRPDREAASGIK